MPTKFHSPQVEIRSPHNARSTLAADTKHGRIERSYYSALGQERQPKANYSQSTFLRHDLPYDTTTDATAI